jgi:DNA polymerase-3 subunit delta'
MTGAKGIGKATLAYRFARHVLSAGAQEVKVEAAPSMSLFGDDIAPSPQPSPARGEGASILDMDPESSLFRRIAAGSHTDLLALHPAYDVKKGVEKDIITVEEARQVPEFLSLTPAEGLWRVVIIDAVDQLNDNAANALLKILEEPPARAMLFLVCHQPGAILPTIRSRCRTLKLAAPTQTQFSQILSQLAPGIVAHDHAALYALSHGSPGYAITLAQENALKWYEGWLGAMQPGAGVEVRQKFAESVGAQKSPATWDAVIHTWNIAMQRLTLYPHYDASKPILRREAEHLATLAAATSPRQRMGWMEEGTRLIRETETFNLDKRYTIRMLADAGQMERLAA